MVIGIRYTHNYNLNTKLKGTRFEWVEFLDFTRHPVLWSVCVEEPAEFQSGACLNACSSRTTCFAAGMTAAAKRSRFNVTHYHGESWKTCTEIFFTFALASRTNAAAAAGRKRRSWSHKNYISQWSLLSSLSLTGFIYKERTSKTLLKTLKWLRKPYKTEWIWNLASRIANIDLQWIHVMHVKKLKILEKGHLSFLKNNT